MSVTAIHLPYKESFEPVVRINDNVKLILTDGIIYGRVTYLEQIEPIIIDLAESSPLPAVSSSTTPIAPGNQYELSDIELGENEFGQWRMKLLDDFLLEMRLPPAVTKHVVRSGSTYLSMLISNIPNMGDFFTYKDKVPTVIPYNIRFETMDMARIMVYGFRYIIERIHEEPENYTSIPVPGKPTQSVVR